MMPITKQSDKNSKVFYNTVYGPVTTKQIADMI